MLCEEFDIEFLLQKGKRRMKKISFKKSMAMVLALAMALALCVVPAFAADSNYTPVAGATTTFDKVLIMDENANVPTIDFEFSIAPGAAIAYDVNGQKIAVYAGDNPAVNGVPTMSGTAANKVSFAPGHATVTSHASATIDAGEKAAVETVTVDFSHVTFAEPGIYRWLINETSADQQGIAYDTQAKVAGSKQRVLDVYVTDDGHGTLAVSSYVFHEDISSPDMSADFGSGEVASAGASVADKSKGFVNEYSTYDIDISKAVSGNQASRDKYFKFEVAITNAGPNVDLDVVISENAKDPAKSEATIYDAPVMKAANIADDDNAVANQQWRTDAQGAVSKFVYLKHGQDIQIKGLAAGANYTITEVPEDYKPSTLLVKGVDVAAVEATEWYYNGVTYASLAEAQAASEADGGAHGDITNNGREAVQAERVNGTAAVVSVSNMGEDHDLDYTNTRNGMVPTGVVLSAASGLALIGIGGGAILFASRKRKEDEE